MLTFIHRNGKIQSYYVWVGWREGGIPEIKSFGINDLEEIKLTEKGYFIYTYTETIAHGNLVDGVWPDYNSDYAFTNQIVVQPSPDGTFRYLSNTIEQKELELPQIEK